MLDDYNVRIIQDGELIKDRIYNIYDPLTMAFEENEGNFFQKYYELAVAEREKFGQDHCSPLHPSRLYNIADGDYFSVSVSLEVYIKMLKGEKPLPFGNLEDRRKYDLIGNSHLVNVEKSVVDAIKNYRT